MSSPEEDDYDVELPPGTPQDQAEFLLNWLAYVENRSDVSEFDKGVARQIAQRAALKIIDRLGGHA